MNDQEVVKSYLVSELKAERLDESDKGVQVGEPTGHLGDLELSSASPKCQYKIVDRIKDNSPILEHPPRLPRHPNPVGAHQTQATYNRIDDGPTLTSAR